MSLSFVQRLFTLCLRTKLSIIYFLNYYCRIALREAAATFTRPPLANDWGITNAPETGKYITLSLTPYQCEASRYRIYDTYYPITTHPPQFVWQQLTNIFFINFYPHWHYSILSPKMRQLQVIKWTLLFYSLFVAYQNITSVYGKHMGSNDTHCTLDSIVVVTPTDLAGIWLVFCIVAESHQWEKTYLLIAVHFSFTSNALVGC